MRYLILSLVLFSCGSNIRIDRVQQQATSAVKVQTMCGSGSGVIVGEHYVLTANHVTCDEDIEPLTLTDNNGLVWRARVVMFDERSDVALLRTDKAMPYRGIKVGKPPAVGDGLCVEAMSPRVARSCGFVYQKHTVGFANDVRHTATVIPGNSGGAMYNAKGELVALVITRGGMGGGSTSLWQHVKSMNLPF